MKALRDAEKNETIVDRERQRPNPSRVVVLEFYVLVKMNIWGRF